MDHKPEFQVDVEKPNQELETITLTWAKRLYNLDDGDVELLKEDKIVRIGDVYLSKAPE